MSPSPSPRHSVVRILLVAALAFLGPVASAQSGRPLPIDVAISIRGHNGRSPVHVSPDGEWVAHTVATADTVARGASSRYSDTGFPFAEGNARMQVTLDHTSSDETIVVGDDDSASWGAVWSPSGDPHPNYSDDGGEAGLWIWNRRRGESRRVGDWIVRPFFGFETVRWSPDGNSLLVKVLPEGRTLAEANALLPAPNVESAPPPTEGDAPSVTVRRSGAAREAAGAAEPEADPADPMAERLRGLAVDLVLVDVESGSLRRLVLDTPVRLYDFSPDGRRVAYSSEVGFAPNAQQVLYDLAIHDLDGDDTTVLAEDVPLRYGIEWSWSPDGRYLAYTLSGQTADGVYVLVDTATGVARELENDAPSFAPGEGEVPPLWSADSGTLYGVGDGSLWSVDPASGEATAVVRIEGWEIRNLITARYGSAVAWSRDDGATLWATARQADTGASGIFALRPETGEAILHLREDRSWSGLFSLAASDAAGSVFYVARDQRQPGEIQALDLDAEATRRVSSINAELDGYPLGDARLIDFRSAHGEPLQGALLLPPGHRPGDRLPMVVFVYGGARGSSSVNRFGLWGSGATFNMHVLATRGYAVLYPDAPVRTGRTTEDLVASVLPAVNAAVDQGYADPDRVAVMGQSYGSLNTLALLSETDRFAAAIISAAVLHPDLFADYLRDNTGYYEQGQGDMGGTIWEFPERYRANSPLFAFDRIETPLLITQGDQDGDLAPSEAIFNALDRLDRHVEYRLYHGEGHVISGNANVRDAWSSRLTFLADHLDLDVAPSGFVSIPDR